MLVMYACAALKSMLLDFGALRATQEAALARKVFDVQTKILDGIESSFELVHPIPKGAGVPSEPLSNDHLMARIAELEKELEFSQERDHLHEKQALEAREMARFSNLALDKSQAEEVRLQAELDELNRGSAPRKDWDSAQDELLDLRAEVKKLLLWKEQSVPREEFNILVKENRNLNQRQTELLQQLAALKAELADYTHALEEVRVYKEQVEQFKIRMLDMTPKEDLSASEAARALMQKQISDLRVTMVARQEHDGVIEEQQQLKMELERCRNKVGGMVAKTQLDFQQAEVERLQVQIDRLNKKLAESVPQVDLTAAQTSISSLDDQNRILTKRHRETAAELNDLKSVVKDSMVPRKDLQDVEVRFRETRDSKTVLQGDYDKSLKQLKDAHNTAESLQSQLRMSTEKLTNATQDLEALRSTCKNLQRQLDESELRVKAKTKAANELSEAVSKTESAKKNLEMELQSSVKEKMYLDAQSVAAEYKKEMDIKTKELEEAKAESKQLQISNTQLAARSVQSFWRRMNVQTVPILKHLKVLDDASRAKEKLAVETQQRETLENVNAEIRLKFHDLNNQVAELTLKLKDSTPKTEVLKVRRELAETHDLLSIRTSELANSAAKGAGLTSQLKTIEAELEELKGSSVAREAHVQLRGDLSQCEVELESKTIELEKLRESHNLLQRRFEDVQVYLIFRRHDSYIGDMTHI